MGNDPSDNVKKDPSKLSLLAGGKSLAKSAAAAAASRDGIVVAISKDEDPADENQPLPQDVNMNRDLNLALQKERRCASKWKYQLLLLQEELMKKKLEEEALSSPDKKKADKEVKEVQEWRDKYNQTTAKLLEVQAARTMLAAEVGKLQHALQREVGDHILISKVLEESGDWKGRSQQICVLKDKVVELKSRLKKQSVDDQPSSNDLFENIQRKEYEQICAKLLVRCSVFNLDVDRDFEHTATYLTVLVEFSKALREELRITKQKLNGVLARRSVLENELKMAKEKMSLLIGKSDNDDRLITALRLEIEAQRQGYFAANCTR